MLRLDLQRFGGSASASVIETYSIENNTSTITFSITVTTNSTTFNQNAYVEGSYSGGASGTLSRQYFNAQKGSTNTLVWTISGIPHNDDGTLSEIIAEIKWYVVSNTQGTASVRCIPTTIPRATTCPDLSGDIESTYNIALNPASSSFGHSLYVAFGNLGGFINANGNIQSDEYIFWNNNNINFTIPASYYSQFGSKYGVGQFRLWTYSGSSRIGEDYGSLTCNCLESRCRPTISGSVKDSNSVTKALTGDENKIIKYFSNVLLSLSISAATSSGDTNSSITSQNVDGTSFSGSSITINKVTKKDFTVTVTNSRGFSTSAIISASGDLVNYFSPSIIINPHRYPDQTSSQVKLTYSGTFFNQSFGAVANTITMKWYWKLSSDTNWTLGGEITPTISGNNISEETIDCGSNYNYQNNYRFKLEVVDKLTSDGTKEQDVVKGVPIYAHGEDWFKHYTDVYLNSGNKLLDSYVLYDNVDGSNETITLSDSVENYSYIEIYFEDTNKHIGYTKVDNPNGKIASLMCCYSKDKNSYIYIYTKNVTISGNSITPLMYGFLIMGDNEFSRVSFENVIHITKVVGYK